jgi:alpha-L-fucosidase
MNRREFLGLAASSLIIHPARFSWEVLEPMQTGPLPSLRVAAFEKMAFGMFVHWGLYSQSGRGEWTQNVHGLPREQYLERMKTFTAKDFDARKLARAAKRAGMNYITLTTRHHEGFSLYDTRGLSKLDVTHTPAKRDLIREFVNAARAEGIVPMFYHTTLDWNDPRFEADFDGYLTYLRQSIELLCTHYGKVGGFWLDGNWSKPNADWKEPELYAAIRRIQPEAIIINNTGIDAMGKTGHSEIDSVTYERGRPKPMDRSGAKKYVAAEMCHTMNFHWGIAQHDFNYLSPAHVIEELCFARRAGANLLMNIGPHAQGKLPEYEVAALARVGDWIELHGGKQGPLFEGRLVGIEGSDDDFALAVGDDLYLFVTELTLTSNSMVHAKPLRGPGPREFKGVSGTYRKATWMDSGDEVKFEQKEGTLTLAATAYPYGTNTVIRVAKLTR